MAQHGIDFPAISGEEGGGLTINTDYQIAAYPTYILIAPNHDIVIQDIWPVPNTQTFINAFEGQGIQQAPCGTSQTIELLTGFQFISSNVDPVDKDMTTVMAEVLSDNLTFVRNSQGSTLRKIGPNWVNNIGDWIFAEGYLVKMSSNDSFTITGSLVDPSTPIGVVAGFQFVSYFPTSAMDALVAFGTIIVDDLDFIRDSQGSMLRKIGPNWVNGIGDAAPGQGYLVKMFADGELIYPSDFGSNNNTFKSKLETTNTVVEKSVVED
ncbi:MAG: hypothetical protein JEY97_14295 [Bacteroidales bacterium]|nr:hypothetical protein [Bacteroidales bacterium]